MHNILPPLAILAIRQSNRWRAGGQPFWELELLCIDGRTVKKESLRQLVAVASAFCGATKL
jgi:hypothetical protein